MNLAKVTCVVFRSPGLGRYDANLGIQDIGRRRNQGQEPTSSALRPMGFSRMASVGAPTQHGILASTEFTALADPAAALKGL